MENITETKIQEENNSSSNEIVGEIIINSEIKTKNQLKNEAKRQEKLQKFQAKQTKIKQTSDVLKADSATVVNDMTSKDKKTSKDIGEYVNKTPEGKKKDMSEPMASSYQPKQVESAWYSWWQTQGYFKPESVLELNPNAPSYIIPIPPPNVTGSLHLGHAMATSIQDGLTRWKRMKGFATLYVPGCDHAGISTQVIVEKNLMKTKNLSRHDLGREAFVAEVWKWKEAYGGRIYEQLKRLGGSMDWDRVKFTLDPDLIEAVNEAFVTLFDQGVIYRANRLVNWSAKLQTTVSDLEVDYQELKGSTHLSAYDHDANKKYEFGILTSFAYKLAPSESFTESDEIIVCTTRPETIPGDVAVAINPNDPRYLKYHGQFLMHPIHKSRLIPVVLDASADMNFGTGALKVTPAHDPIDFEIAQRHSLPIINILDNYNRLNENAGVEFNGLMRFDARVKIIEMLKNKGLYRGSESHTMVIPLCNRSGDIIEPRILPQWWMKCQGVASKAAEAVKSKQLTLIPADSEKIWFGWLDNIRDWCLSRQLWWGHRVPAYSILIMENTDGVFEHKDWVAGRTEVEALKKALAKFPHIKPENLKLEQDPDVLDTWFSSGLWPFSTLGWPHKTPDFERFYPTSLLETGRDIIFFWVARMVMLGIHLTGKVPFSSVFLHSMVRDAHGRKMSKTLGNVVDPLDVIEGITLQKLHDKLLEGNLDVSEIKKASETQRKDFPNGIGECGTDALRFALCNYTSQGSDVNLDILRVEGYRRFCNKLWNAVKFALMKLGEDFIPDSDCSLKITSESPYDQWILARLNVTIKELNDHLEDYNFMKATSTIHSFWIYDLCDVYIEAIKPILVLDNNEMSSASSSSLMTSKLSKNTLYTCLDQGLKMLHPFMPFITEELYQRLPRRSNDCIPTISLTSFPEPKSEWEALSSAVSEVNYLQSIVHSARSLANDHQIKGSFSLSLSLNGQGQEMKTKTSTLVQDYLPSLQSLIKGLASFSLSTNESGINKVENIITSVLPDSSILTLYKL